ncbi:uncharacterized protein METZ01_LOCUS463860 [marine metagenome]|uniref:Uncharacterized protein n=1 Tax=marine metagenome TaxID=408172 RepID=A0A383ASU2_9ZZZZ
MRLNLTVPTPGHLDLSTPMSQHELFRELLNSNWMPKATSRSNHGNLSNLIRIMLVKGIKSGTS